MRKVLFVSSEAVPYIKTGGLADVVGSLPRYFDKEEMDVRVIIPKYACMDDKFLDEMRYLCHFYVDLNWRKQYVGIFEAKHKGVTYYLVDNEFYFAGPNPYNQIHEDVEKFAYFSKAVLAALPFIDFQPDVIHCNDWQTGLVPVFLHTSFGSDPYYCAMKTVFSIHNLKFQGRWLLPAVMDITGLPENVFNAKGLEAYGEANLLKGGLIYADAITTVSPTYAYDITTIEGGEGLHGVLYERRNDLYGILNGLDYDEYNPETDDYISYNYAISNMVEGKRNNKLALQREMGLPENEKAFMIGMVSRMTDQKGFDLVAYMLEEMLKTMDIQVVVLGTGEDKYQDMFRYFENRFPDKMKAHIGYSEERAHKIYASVDAFLMPSLFEPCGLSQLMSLRYGTIPMVRETGGLKDTVEPYNEYDESGVGFSFANYNAHEMLNMIRYAESIFKQKERWHKLMERGMKRDYSWKASAKEYVAMYDQLFAD